MSSTKKQAKMSAKQQRFVDEYLIDLNATQAALRAGYSEKGAQVQGSRLLSNAMVRAAIEARQEKRSTKLAITVDRIELELARVAFSDMARFANWGPNGVALVAKDELTEDETRAVSEVSETTSESTTAMGGSESHSRKIKLHDKLKALELLGKRHGMWEENINLKGELSLKGSWLDLAKAAVAEAANADAKKPK